MNERISLRATVALLMIASLLFPFAASSALAGTDIIPPETVVFISGGDGANGWNISAVNVTLVASDSGSGVNRTNYSIDGGNWHKYADKFQVSGNGIHVLQFYSVDNENNTEATKHVNISIDGTPPSLSLEQVSGSTVGSGNFRVSWTCSDSISGIDGFEILSDGALFDILGNSSRNDRVTNLADGWHNITVRAYDKAGNFADKTISVKVFENQPEKGIAFEPLIGIIAIIAMVLAMILIIREAMRIRKEWK